MQFAAACHEELIRTIRFLDAQGHVGFEFSEESIAQVPRGQVLPFPSGERTIVHGKGHLDGWFVDCHASQCNGVLRVGDRIADAHFVQTCHCDDFTSFRSLNIRPVKAGVDREVGHFSWAFGAILP